MDIKPFKVVRAKRDDLGVGDILRYNSYATLYEITEFNPDSTNFRLASKNDFMDNQAIREEDFPHPKSLIPSEFYLVRRHQDIQRLHFLRIGYFARHFKEVSAEFNNLLVELEI